MFTNIFLLLFLTGVKYCQVKKCRFNNIQYSDYSKIIQDVTCALTLWRSMCNVQKSVSLNRFTDI